MQTQLREFLQDDAGVSALVAQRIDWGRRPQGDALPAIVLTVASAPRTGTMTGRCELVGYLVQIDCWGADYKSASDVAHAVIAALDLLLVAPFDHALVESQRGPLLDPGEDGEADLYRSSLDVRVWAQDPA
jgi:hypothetical protein